MSNNKGVVYWRPISTAPKDKEVLLFVDIAAGPPLVVQGCWFHDDDAGESGWLDYNGDVVSAAFWMPLPEPPNAA